MNSGRRRAAGWVGLLVAVALLAYWSWPTTADPSAPTQPITPDLPSVGSTSRGPRALRTQTTPEETPPPSTSSTEPAASSSTPSAEPTFSFEVTVLRADGSPAADATVALFADDDEGDWMREVARGVADAKGVAALRAVECDARVAAWLGAESAATGELFAIKDRHEATVRLGPSMVVRGRVLRADGAPQAATDVTLSSHPWFGSDFGLAMKTTADGAGRFEFAALPLAGVDRLNPPYVEAMTKDMARGFAETDLERPNAELVVRLTDGFSVRGRFVEADGRPAAVEVCAAGSRQFHATTDADGRVTLRLPDAKFRLVARRPTSRPFISDFDVEVACPPFIGDPIVEKRPVARSLADREAGSGDLDLGEVVMTAGKPLVGRVVDAAGEPRGSAVVTLLLGDVCVATVVADADGRFEFPEVGDEPHRLHVRDALDDPTSSAAQHADVDDVRAGGPELRVVLVEQLLVRLVFLADGDRAPVVAREVRVRAWRHGEKRECVGTQSVGGDMSDFALEVPAPGAYDVEAIVVGYEPQRFESVEVVAGRAPTLELLLRKKQE
jgi:hypothetical protein